MATCLYSGADGNSNLIERHPTLVADEVKALEAANAVFGDLVPRPIAFDPSRDAHWPTGALDDIPAGAPVIHNLDPVALVEPLVRLHTANVDVYLPLFHHWFDHERFQVPDWSASPPRLRSLLVELVHT